MDISRMVILALCSICALSVVGVALVAAAGHEAPAGLIALPALCIATVLGILARQPGDPPR